MQLVRHYLEGIANIGIYPLISLFIFLTFFIVMVIHTLSLNMHVVKEASELPLDDCNNSETINKNN